ncbi:substrate-binding domain-containing protein [Streptomyces sp. MNU89]|uniref:substrate-binding domain-containing protein n=1 Tax=Streptomyces sp. MNU89 TaxID=2560025 RepID=UPI001E3FD557|nr:substrate-binding domain-containing protein [Streptomyces sp. MNU89]MCC9738408.1 substrate-binding domain-containing protein [Streptomyces sp. MNU89]
MIILAGCQSSQGDAAGGGTAGPAAAEAARERLKAAKAPIAAKVPDSGPMAQPDKSVVLVPCSVASEGCAQPAYAARQAAEAIGWKVKLIDGKDTADSQNAAVRQALTLHPDAIITFAINPSTIRGSLEQAREDGVTVIASSAVQSDLPDFSGIPSRTVWEETGSLLADYAIAETDGDVKALVLHDTGFEVLGARFDAFTGRLEECETCEILESQSFTFADLATAVPRMVQQMAQRHPDFNTVYIDYDYAVPAVLQGLRAIGAEDKIVLGSEGTSTSIASIRHQDGQTATTAVALDWIGWSNVDALNRIFAGESPEPAADALAVKLIDHAVAIEQGIEGLWDGDVDFKSAYLKLWGVDRT